MALPPPDITSAVGPSVPAASRWRVIAMVALACVILLATNGFILSGLTIFDSAILAELRIGNAALRLRDTITVMTLGLTVSVVGSLLDRIDVRPILVGGLLMMAVAFIGYHWVDALWQIYALHVLMGIAQAASGVVACVFLVSGWTQRHRGLALGIMIAGSSLGNAVVPALNTAIAAFLPWRDAVLLGAAFALLLIPLVLVVVKEPGRTAPQLSAPDQATATSVAPVLASRSFGLLGLIAGTTVFCVLALATNLVLFAAHAAGTGAGSGPLLLFALFGAAVAAQLGAGAATYRVPTALIHTAAILVMLAGALVFAVAPPHYALIAVTLFGLGWGANSTMLQVRPSILFAGPALGRTLSLLAVAETVGGGMGPVVAGYVNDHTGGFTAIFWLIALLLTAASAASLRLRDT